MCGMHCWHTRASVWIATSFRLRPRAGHHRPLRHTPAHPERERERERERELLIPAFAVAMHGHVKRKCHRHGQSCDFRLLQLHLRRSGQESRHLFLHSLGLLRSTQLDTQVLDVRLQSFASAALAIKVLFDTSERMRDTIRLRLHGGDASAAGPPSRSPGLHAGDAPLHRQKTLRRAHCKTSRITPTILPSAVMPRLRSTSAFLISSTTLTTAGTPAAPPAMGPG